MVALAVLAVSAVLAIGRNASVVSVATVAPVVGAVRCRVLVVTEVMAELAVLEGSVARGPKVLTRPPPPRQGTAPTVARAVASAVRVAMEGRAARLRRAVLMATAEPAVPAVLVGSAVVAAKVVAAAPLSPPAVTAVMVAEVAASAGWVDQVVRPALEEQAGRPDLPVPPASRAVPLMETVATVVPVTTLQPTRLPWRAPRVATGATAAMRRRLATPDPVAEAETGQQVMPRRPAVRGATAESGAAPTPTATAGAAGRAVTVAWVGLAPLAVMPATVASAVMVAVSEATAGSAVPAESAVPAAVAVPAFLTP